MGSLFTLNIRFPTFTPIITVITNVQVDHKERTSDKIMAPHSTDHLDGEDGPSYSQVLKDAVGDSNGLPRAKNSPSDAPPRYSNGAVSRRKGKNSSSSGEVDESYAHKYEDGTALQKHAAYFDPDGDGIIWPWDTYRGCRNYGWGRCTLSNG